MTTAPSSVRKPARELVCEVTHKYITVLQDGYLKDRSAAVATLAQLRRGAGRLPHDAPELWGLTGAEPLYEAEGLSEADKQQAEAAMFLAVTLYALHQQSRSDRGMHQTGREFEFGAAVRRLMRPDEIDDNIRLRFVRAGTASNLEVLAYRLRELVSLMGVTGSVPSGAPAP
jgi:CRISPR system Cascade subunit CasB